MQRNDTTSDNETKKPDSVVSYWLNEIKASQNREKAFRKEGQRILDIYSAKKPEEIPYNILYSNTETLLPALYSSVPRPVVSRRFKDADPLGRYAAEAGKRVLEFLMDTNVEGYETFDEGVRSAVLDALLPGRGVTCIKYDAEIGQVPGDDTEEGGVVDQEPTEYKAAELVCTDTKSWNRVFFGYAKKWSKVPWVAYEEHIDKDEAERLFGADVAAKMTFAKNEDDADDEEDGKSNEENRNQGEKKTACVYQIWDKEGGKKVRYVSSQYPEGFLKVEDDPLGLSGFFNCPKPMMFMEKSNDLLPVALYMLYENQAKELNEISRRINRVVRAIKAKAIYDGELGDDIKNLVDADDNELVPADKSSSLAAEKGLQNAIWFWPIEQLVNVLNQLILAREQCKRVIFEVTGISDIIRGSSVASETATAQNLKSQWGTLRLKRLQKEVQRYARDILRMMLEVAAAKFSVETWAKMTGLPFVTSEQKQQSQKIAMAAQQIGQQPDEAAMKALQAPVWEDVLKILQDDMQRAYRIDIETNSTVELEATEDKQDMAEVMAAIGQALNGLTPLVQAGSLPFEAAQAMLLTIVRRFRFGSEVEDMIRAMKPPKPPEDGKAAAEQAKMQQEQARMQAEQQQQQVENERIAQVEMAKHQREQQAEANRRETEMQKLLFERETEMARIEAERQAKLSELQSQRSVEQFKAKVAQEAELAKLAFEKWKVETEQQTKLEVARINAEANVTAAAMKPQEKSEAD
jgi:hypothetical protein